MVVNLKKEMLIFLSFFFGMSLIFYWLMNGGAYAQQLRYQLLLSSPWARERLENLVVPAPNPSETTPQIAAGDYRLIIPKIGVETPIGFPEQDTIEKILESLESGVGFYPGSVLPGQDGRAVILGHSSRASWYRGDYATIFALLDKLEISDEFYITGDGKKYTYRVFAKNNLVPSATNEILSGPSEKSELDLLTCWPVGSARKRTLIQAKLISIE